jgi:tetratricopeptide (TPR) repeat protein
MDAPAEPGLDRRRLLAAIGVCTGVALGVLALALLSRGPEPRTSPFADTEPLQGRPPLVYDLPARYLVEGTPAARVRRLEAIGDPASDASLALALAGALLDAGRERAAVQRLDEAAALLGPDDPRVQVGRALAAYRDGNPQRADDLLAALAADRASDPLPTFERGLVLLFAGDTERAREWLARARDLDREGFYGVRADNVLHPGIAPGYPPWFASRDLARGPVAALRRKAQAAPGDPDAQLALAAALQADGKRRGAREAAALAVAADPDDLDAQVAVAVLGFDKDRPAAAVGALGTILRGDRSRVEPRLHLALLLSWIGRREQAREQFRLAAQADPDGRLGKLARELGRA